MISFILLHNVISLDDTFKLYVFLTANGWQLIMIVEHVFLPLEKALKILITEVWDSLSWRGHPSVHFVEGNLPQGGTMESFFFKVWEAASAKIFHQSIPLIWTSMLLPMMTMTSSLRKSSLIRELINSRINSSPRMRIALRKILIN